MIFSEDIFQPDFPFAGTHLVAASAGTGKTYNIQNIYARLIMEKGFSVSQIQVMTFTDAATKELRARLRCVLSNIQIRYQEIKNGKTESVLDENERIRIDKLLASADQNAGMDKAIPFVELALQEFDTAAISTIHGFCERALARFAFETHMKFRPEIENNKAADLQRAVDDWWRIHHLTAKEQYGNDLTKKTLQDFVAKLGQKSDWKLEATDETTAAGYMLARAAEIVEKYESDRTNREKQTYDDILRSLRASLQNPQSRDMLVNSLRIQFKAALIDEFQDTDPVQYEIFQKVFLNGEIPVFFVGDPKQAIYSFRGGDIFTYREASQNVDGKKKYRLNENFRSTANLMNAVNLIFHDEQVNGQSIYTFGDSEIDYAHDIRAHGKTALKINGQDDPAPFKMIKIPTDRKIGDMNEECPKEEKKYLKYLYLVREIIRILTAYQNTGDPEINLSPKDIAVLVTKNKNARAICKLLKKYGIPSVVENSGSVFVREEGWHVYVQTQIANDVYSVLRAVQDPNEKNIRRALLCKTPFFSDTPAEIAEIDEAKLAEKIRFFSDLKSHWVKGNLAYVLNKLEAQGACERMAAMPDGERMLADYHQITELLFKTVKEQGPSPEALLKWLFDRMTHGDTEFDADEYARQLESENNAVRIMTIHKSKGLEFPVVFLPDCQLIENKNADLNSYHDPDQDFLLTFSLNDNEGLGELEAGQEQMRLLYVAMTRAIQRTVVIYSEAAGGTAFQKLVQRIETKQTSANFPIEMQDQTGEIIDESMLEQYAPVITSQTLEKNRQIPFIFKEVSKGSYSALSKQQKKNSDKDSDMENAQDHDSAEGETPWTGSEKRIGIFRVQGGTAIGTCWHEILEKISFSADDEKIRTQAEKSLQENGFDPKSTPDEKTTMLEMTVNMIKNVLCYDMKSADGSPLMLNSIDWQDRLSEQEFDFSSASAQDKTDEITKILKKYWEGKLDKEVFLKAIEDWDNLIPKGFLNGFIDLIFRKDGRYYIIDWKSNSLGGKAESFTEDGVRNEMAKHRYFIQYLMYSAVLHKYLEQNLSGYSWEKNFGGIRYVFLRGIAENGPLPVFADRPSENLLNEIAQVLGIKEVNHD